MFKNRSIQMSLVKPQTTGDTDLDTTVADLAYITSEASKTMAKSAGALMLSYMAADTLRKIAVHTAKTYIK